jgi:alkylhydroperoxidase family enzyme
MSSADIERLRDLGLEDGAIHDVVQVAALFNYYDRLADGLGIDPEPDFPTADQ